MSLPLREHIEKDGFRLRGLEVTRIDAFSDVVFGFAITLLVVSLEIPKTYAELHATLRGFVPFAISFFFLMMVWVAHYKFFRRMGLHDLGTISINAVQLFVVLFYVYPLKFLFTFVVDVMSGHTTKSFETNGQIVELMTLYGIGFASVYLLFCALYWNAWRQREALALNPLERILTVGYLLDAAGVAGVGLLAALLTRLVPAHLVGLTGWTYMLIALANRITGVITRKRMRKVQKFHQGHAST